MDTHEVNRLRAALELFVADVFASVPRKDQRARGECYLRGLMLDGRRKSIQPMAARLPGGNMQALQQFVNQSPWDPLPVRRRIAERLSEVVRPKVWVIDDVSFPKCGKASVGVARQYCGAVGKRANCQVAVSVHAATDTASCPLDWQLYLPREWTDEPDRCRRAGVPQEVVHQEKWRLALSLLDTLAEWQLQAPVIVADAGYGVSTPFRLGLQERGLSYVLALQGQKVAHPEDAEPHQPAYGGLGPPTLPRYRTPPRALSILAAQAGAERYSEVTWRQGSKGVMASRFTVLTVRPAGKQSLAAAQETGGGRSRWDGVLPTQTLLVEWPKGQDRPTDYWISNLPATTPTADLVQWAKMRWRIEHDYRELK
ncbi:IS701 family transposase, partial [Streptomyces beigongshangae]|uniref:IS701 family transposase n=1 Tax=Streptomyces beigongshangae TaxID=2841597 RepID=UPI001C843187